MALAIFDLDNTLIGGDSDHSWGEFLCERGIVDPKTYQESNDQFYRDYQAGTLDILEYLEFALKPLTRFSMEELNALHNDFMQSKIQPIMLPKALALLDKHRSQGDTLLIITATNYFITAPIARALNVPHILATDPEIHQNRYTGKISGTPCFQDGKVTRLTQWLSEREETLEGSYFYSDSINDAPLLEKVDHPVAVDPCEKLRAYAEKKNIPIVSLR